MFEKVLIVRHKRHGRTRIGVNESDKKPGEQQSGTIKELHQDGHLKNNRLVSGKPYSWLSSIRQSCRAVKKSGVIS